MSIWIGNATEAVTEFESGWLRKGNARKMVIFLRKFYRTF
jgi:hypothetical protein